MLRKLLAGVAAGSLLLSACTPVGTGPAGSTPAPSQSVGKSAQQGLQVIEGVCTAVQPIAAAAPAFLATASASDQAKAKQAIGYVNSVCGSAEAMQSFAAKDPTGTNTKILLQAAAAGILALLPAVLQATGVTKAAQ